MKIIEDILDLILSFNDEMLKKYMIILAGSSLLLTGVITYYIYNNSSSLTKKIKILNDQIYKSSELMNKYNKILNKKKNVYDQLEKEKEFDLRSFFENFSNELGIKTEPWIVISNPVEGNIQLEEESLIAAFKNINTQKLTHILSELSKENIIYIKSVKITKSTAKNINANIDIGTFIYR